MKYLPFAFVCCFIAAYIPSRFRDALNLSNSVSLKVVVAVTPVESLLAPWDVTICKTSYLHFMQVSLVDRTYLYFKEEGNSRWESCNCCSFLLRFVRGCCCSCKWLFCLWVNFNVINNIVVKGFSWRDSGSSPLQFYGATINMFHNQSCWRWGICCCWNSYRCLVMTVKIFSCFIFFGQKAIWCWGFCICCSKD